MPERNPRPRGEAAARLGAGSQHRPKFHQSAARQNLGGERDEQRILVYFSVAFRTCREKRRHSFRPSGGGGCGGPTHRREPQNAAAMKIRARSWLVSSAFLFSVSSIGLASDSKLVQPDCVVGGCTGSGAS